MGEAAGRRPLHVFSARAFRLGSFGCRVRDHRRFVARHLLGCIGAMTLPAIQLTGVTVAYDRKPAVRHVTGCFSPGSLTAIAGPNGAGKSTLIRALIGELPLASGKIDLGGLSARSIGYLPQAAEIERQFPLSVADVIMLGAWGKIGAFGRLSPQTAAKAREALLAVGLEGFETRHIGSLSAGQFQRVLFARLLLQDARIIVLDEPFTAIDARTTHDLLEIVSRWHRGGRTVIAVLHDFDQIRRSFPETLLLAREAIQWGDTGAVLSPANLLKARAMAECWDEESEPGLERAIAS